MSVLFTALTDLTSELDALESLADDLAQVATIRKVIRLVEALDVTPDGIDLDTLQAAMPEVPDTSDIKSMVGKLTAVLSIDPDLADYDDVTSSDIEAAIARSETVLPKTRARKGSSTAQSLDADVSVTWELDGEVVGTTSRASGVAFSSLYHTGYTKFGLSAHDVGTSQYGDWDALRGDLKAAWSVSESGESTRGRFGARWTV